MWSNWSVQLDHCVSTEHVSVFMALFVSYVLLLPLFVFILYTGFQRRRTWSHSDFFTFNMVAFEMFGVFGAAFYGYSLYTKNLSVMILGVLTFSLVSPGQTVFHLLTCMERYLAVVHPVTYLGLRGAGGVRIRNISVGCAWLLCFGILVLTGLSTGLFIDPVQYYVCTSMLGVASIVVVSFCSLSALRVLIRPGPGKGGGSRERVDQSKQRAFYTIMAVMGALVLRFLSSLVTNVVNVSLLLSCSDSWVVAWSLACFCLPSSLVLPLLFLQRAGKLPGCKRHGAD